MILDVVTFYFLSITADNPTLLGYPGSTHAHPVQSPSPDGSQFQQGNAVGERLPSFKIARKQSFLHAKKLKTSKRGKYGRRMRRRRKEEEAKEDDEEKMAEREGGGEGRRRLIPGGSGRGGQGGIWIGVELMELALFTSACMASTKPLINRWLRSLKRGIRSCCRFQLYPR